MPQPKKPKKNIAPGILASIGAVATPAQPGGTGSGRSYEQPIPTGSSSKDKKRIPSPDGRWEYDSETGQWIPLAGAPIGVPTDYRPVVPGPGPAAGVKGKIPEEEEAATYAPRGQLPRYFEGDEYTIFAGLSPETIAGIQQSLQDAGIISPTAALPYGVLDNTTAGAMKQILATANVNGIDWQVALEQSVSDAIALTGGGYLNEEGVPYSEIPAPPEPPKLPTGYLMNPQDVRAVVQEVAARTIGRKNIPSEVIDAFTANFNTMLSANYFNEEAMGAPSLETAAEEFIKGDYGDEAEAMELSTVMDTIDSMLAGPFGA